MLGSLKLAVKALAKASRMHILPLLNICTLQRLCDVTVVGAIQMDSRNAQMLIMAATG